MAGKSKLVQDQRLYQWQQLQRYKIVIEYDGTDFSGWQRQGNGPSIQHSLEDALFSLTRQHISVHGAGRTDAGVHALGQVAHFDLPQFVSTNLPPEKLLHGLNHFLRSQKVIVVSAEFVDSNFHARFSAVLRHYVYVIQNRNLPSVFEQNRAWWIREALDAKKMHEVAQLLVGYYNFDSFRSSRCQAKSAIRTINHLKVKRYESTIYISIKARSFLHNQVRIIVGSLRNIGNGSLDKDDLQKALLAKDRTKTGVTAPAHGLYLTKISY